MQKILFQYHLKNDDDTITYKGEGTCENGKISFLEENTKVIFDYNLYTLKRENEEMILSLDFKNSQASIKVKNIDNIIDLKVIVKKIKIEESYFLVNYSLDNSNFLFELKWDIGGE